MSVKLGLIASVGCAALILLSCNNSRESQIAFSPQTSADRSAAVLAAGIRDEARDALEDGGASAGDPSQFGCQTRDYSDTSVRAAVQAKLSSLQRLSISEGVEYCGAVYIDEGCTIAFTQNFRGTSHQCSTVVPGNGLVLAGYHTHGVSDGTNAGEVPSDTDFRTVISSRIDNYVATPSGRLWRVDAFSQRALLECEGCLPHDPNSRFDQQLLQVGASYSLSELLAVFRSANLVSGG